VLIIKLVYCNNSQGRASCVVTYIGMAVERERERGERNRHHIRSESGVPLPVSFISFLSSNNKRDTKCISTSKRVYQNNKQKFVIISKALAQHIKHTSRLCGK